MKYFNPIIYLLASSILFIVSCKKVTDDSTKLRISKGSIDVSRAHVKVEELIHKDLKINERGICWSVGKFPNLTDHVVKDTSLKGAYEITFGGLSPNTSYYVRAYNKNSEGIIYSKQLLIKTHEVPELGDTACGGIVVYICVPGDLNYIAGETHGLICDFADLSTGIQWGCEGFMFTTSNNAIIGMGKWNTEHLIEVCTDTYTAATICNEYEARLYDDWFLPSKNELNILYLNQQWIGGFGDAFYWSSTEYNDYLAHIQYLNTGVQYHAGKRAAGRVRAVREF